MTDILTILGARPQFVKAAVVSKALHEAGIREEIIHTGQHYDKNMSDAFFDELGIPAPVANLAVGSGTHGKQTAIMLEKIEEYMIAMDPAPKFLMVYGDTNSTLAGALAASKLNIPIIHVEAGLRSFNREMPEEVNRLLTDHISSYLFCSSETGVRQLQKEGITKNVFDVGDVMYDAVRTFLKVAESKGIKPDVPDNYSLMTIHRPSNTDNPENLNAIISAIGDLGKTIVWPVHPRAKNLLENHHIPENLILTEPKPYFEMLMMIKHADKVLTDSGGLQKEAYWQEKQCITIREETEWIETLDGGWNTLTGPNREKIRKAFESEPVTPWKPLYGDGSAAVRIAGILEKACR